MNIEKLDVDDLPQLAALTPEGWKDITQIHTMYLSSAVCNPVKVTLDGRIAGIGTAIVFNKTGWLGHIIVDKDHRNKGLGSFIVKNLIEYMTGTCSCRSITLTATELGFPVYLKLGFAVQSQYIELASENTVENGIAEPQTIIPFKDDRLPDLLALDRLASGEDRAGIISGGMMNGLVYMHNGKAAGYYLPDFNEGPIIASDQAAGIALLKLKIRNSCKVILPEDNTTGYEFLVRNGFKETKRIKRMVYGERFPWRPEYVYNRIGGFAG